MAGADNKVAQVAGAAQNYFKESWMNQERRKFRSPLASSELGMKASIPKGGAYAQFRKFANFTVPTNGTDDGPKKYAESDGDPSSGRTQSATLVEVPIAEMRDFISLGNILRAVDVVDQIELSYKLFETQIQRWAHRWVNQAFVNGVSDTNSHTGGSYLPASLYTAYAGGAANFAALTRQQVFTVEDFKRAKAALVNDGVPEVSPGMHAAIIDNAICQQLESDPYFRECIMRGYKISEAFGGAKTVDMYGLHFIIQDDPYRCKLASAGGALATRSDTGDVHVAHVIGKGAFGYVDLNDEKTMKRLMGGAGFKVQDISKTGVELTIGYNVPFQAGVIDRAYGLNIAGCTNYDMTVSSFA